VHSFSDLAGDAMTFMSIKFAAAPFDAEYPYGRGHFETLGTLGVSTLLVFSAGGVGMSALESLVEIGSASGTDSSQLRWQQPLLGLVQKNGFSMRP